MNTAASPQKMKPEIWGRLPVEILDHILSLLPLKIFFNLRSTCKHFNSLIFSPTFISKHSSSSLTYKPHSPPPFSSFLLLSHPQFHRQFLLYDSILSRWRILALSLPLPSSFGAAQLLCSSSNGLLCLSPLASSSLLVCNLLARSSRLIDFPTHPFHFESVTLIPSSQGYKIFIICSGSAFVFDSSGNSWNQFSVFDAILKGNSHQEGVFSNGYLYFTTPEPFSIVGFEFETGKWERRMEELPGEIAFARLVGNGEGKIYLVGGIGRHGISRSMKVWELRDDQDDEGIRREWVEAGSLPEMMCRKFMAVCYHNYEHVYCFIHGGMICVCCYTWPEVLYYKISRQTWHWLPKCPSLPEKWSCGFRWFSFVPNLYASV